MSGLFLSLYLSGQKDSDMKRPLLLCFLSLLFIRVSASPAMPGKVRVKQPDGTYIEVYVRGDEFFSWYERVSDGSVMKREADGFVRAVADPSAFFSSASKLHAERRLRAFGTQRVAPGKIENAFPTEGEVRGLFLLVEYPDVKFSEGVSRELYEELLNSESYSGELSTGSVRSYFKDQSGGKFTPVFDVAGPYCMSHPRKHYGYSESGAEPVWEMFEEACSQADAEGVDFTKYDSDGDGFVDFVFVLYAGYGEAQGGPQESVWPQQVELGYKVWTAYDGLILGKGACSCELHGNTGRQLDGIGTVCHEFGHVLGLPDIYDVFYSGSYGLGRWDVMDVGSYNNESRTPAGYTAMEKYTLGWLTPTVLTAQDGMVSLGPSCNTDDAYFIVSDKDADEYYTLENRQRDKWDAALPGHGMLVSHIKYDRAAWESNMVNTSRNPYDHVALVAADNMLTTESEGGDVYPGTEGVTEFSPATRPAQEWHAKGSGTFSLTGITETDGLISFIFAPSAAAGVSAPFIDAELYGRTLSVNNPLGRRVEVFSAGGSFVTSSDAATVKARLDKGLYVIRQGCHSIKINVR